MRKRIRRYIGYRLDRIARWCLRDVGGQTVYVTNSYTTSTVPSVTFTQGNVVRY